MVKVRRQNVVTVPAGVVLLGDMGSAWDSGVEQLVIWMAVLAVLIAVAYYVLDKIRPKAIQKEPKASKLLSKFREIHDQGGLSDEEFRTIKTNLASQLQDELSDSGEKG